ncbi:hypothetical protein DL96DRAFT_1599008 [Flagelloscypha sp. PMI_526]|nr:hypothetical protein DL96DRAFT_1599008 [Flagelloscypha sp. PMI_526]
MTSFNQDSRYLIRTWALHGFFYASVFVPMAVALSLPARFFRATFVGSAATSAVFAGLGYLRFSFMDEDALRARRLNDVYDANRIRLEDYSTIGSVLSGVLVPAIFWKRAPIHYLILGGATIGTGLGMTTHYVRFALGHRPPQSEVPQLAIPVPQSESQSKA